MSRLIHNLTNSPNLVERIKDIDRSLDTLNDKVGTIPEGTDIGQLITDLQDDKQDKLIAGEGISIENNVISSTYSSTEWGEISGDITDQTDLQNALDSISGSIPTNTSDLTNDSGFITNSVNNLINYYLKSETYTKTEVDNLIGSIQNFHYEIYPDLGSVTTPETNVLYLIGPTGTGSDKYEEYVYSNNNFVKIGDTSIDLSGYVTVELLNNTLSNYTTTTDLAVLLSGKQNVLTAGTNIQINGTVISATDTTYTAGTGISIDTNNVISNTQTSAEWGNITGTLSNQTDLQNALNTKADVTYVDAHDTIVSSTAPSNPTEGMIWYDTTNDVIKTYNGTSWDVVNSAEHFRVFNQNDLTTAAEGQELYDFVKGTGNMAFLKANYNGYILAFNTNQETSTRSTMTFTCMTTGPNLIMGLVELTLSSGTVTAISVNVGSSAISQFTPNNAGTAGQILIKTSNRYEWQTLDADDIDDTNTTNKFVTQSEKDERDSKQDKLYAGDNVSIDTVVVSDKAGPCPDGYHIPTKSEWESLMTLLNSIGITTISDTKKYMHLPFDGYISTSNNMSDIGTKGYYRCSDASGADESYYFGIDSSTSGVASAYRTNGYAIRPFKDTPVSMRSPEGIGENIYYNGNAAVYWNAEKGFLSITANQRGYDWITIADKNLGSATVWSEGDVETYYDCSYFQRGNNNGFGSWPSGTSTTVDASGYGPGNYYSNTLFVRGTKWDTSDNRNLWGGVSAGTFDKQVISAIDTTYIAGDNISISGEGVISAENTTYIAGEGIKIWDNYSPMRGPCPEGYHIPTHEELILLSSLNTEYGLGTDDGSYTIPVDGYLGSDGTYSATDQYYGDAILWGCQALDDGWGNILADALGFSSIGSGFSYWTSAKGPGLHIRPFKDTGVTPDNTWTDITPTPGGWETKTLPAGAGIFHNATLGLVTMSTDALHWVTMSDKNLGATTVYHIGDTLSEANCGKFYQRGNNYGFAYTGAVNVSSTLVDASGYGPGNYYSSDTFINTNSTDWSSVTNNNLWGGEEGVRKNEIVNEGVLSVNGNTGDVTVNEPIVSANAPANPTEGMIWYDTTNDQLKVYDGTNWNVTGGGTSTYEAGAGIDIIEGGVVLPVGYTNLEYIGSDGSAYIDTGIAINTLTNPKIVTTFKMLSFADIDWFGTSTNSQNTIIWNVNSSSQSTYIRRGTTSYRTISLVGRHMVSELVFSDMHTLDVGGVEPTGTVPIVVDGVHIANLSASSGASFASTETILVGKARGYNGSCQFKNFAIYSNGVLVFNGVACKNPLDEVGLYDTVSETFFGSDGNDFSAGAEIGAYSTISNTGVLSVNGETGNVIVNDNTKTFYLSSYQDLTTAQAAYDWYAAGKNPVLMLNNTAYFVHSFSSNRLYFGSVNTYGAHLGSYSQGVMAGLYLAISGTAVTGIASQLQTTSPYVLATGRNYATPYNPEYPGSPATKKYVDDKVATAMGLGKFLSIWDSTTGQPDSFPTTLPTPYTYTTGDYYLVGTISSATPPVNYKPDGSSYTGSASNVPETDDVQVGDIYIYDGSVWLLQINHGKTVSFSEIAGQPSDNANLETALNAKQDLMTAGDGIAILNSTDYSAMQGPCDTGYHIPLLSELQGLDTIFTNLGISTTDRSYLKTYLKMPFSGYRSSLSSGDLTQEGQYLIYRSAEAVQGGGASCLYYNDYNSSGGYMQFTPFGGNIRPFKDEPVVPDSGWTVLYQGTGDAGVFYDSTLGLISFSDDGTNWTTIADKNLGATVVYNSGDTLGQNNCGNFYQRGNCNGFPHSGSVTTSGSQVDTTGYGPGNYYSSSTFIAGMMMTEWRNPANNNLWGGETGVVTLNNAITNTGVLSVNGNTGSVTVNEPIVSSTTPANPTEGMIWYDTTNDILKAYDGTNWNIVGDDASNINTKTFLLATVSDLTTGQAIYDWFAAGKYPLVFFLNTNTGLFSCYTLYQTSGNQIVFATDTMKDNTGPSLNIPTLTMNISSGTVTSMSAGLITTTIPTVNDGTLTITQNGTSVGTFTANQSGNTTIATTDTTYTAGEGIEIKNGPDYSAMQGPAPDGFHIPSGNEWTAIRRILITTFGLSSNNSTAKTYLKMPAAGGLQPQNSDLVNNGSYGSYSSSVRRGAGRGITVFHLGGTSLEITSGSRGSGYSVRPFKDEPAVPDNSWTTLYDGSSVATDAGIFHNSTLGLISLSGDGTTWFTIADKNLGATVVYNSGDTLSEANCGKFYQWGNNYGFAWTGNVTTSSTQVDASNYGPGNYYSSSTFITTNSNPYDWSSVQNDNLWGGVTGVVTLNNAITNTGVISVNGQTGDVTVNDFSPTSAGTTGQILTKTSNGYDWEDKQTKVFDMPTDLTTAAALAVAQDAYDWYIAGNIPVLKRSADNGGKYNFHRLSRDNGSNIGFNVSTGTGSTATAPYHWMFIRHIVFNISSGTVTSVSQAYTDIYVSNTAPGAGTGDGYITLVI